MDLREFVFTYNSKGDLPPNVLRKSASFNFHWPEVL